MATILLYNLSGTEKYIKLKRIFMMLGISSREVNTDEYGHSLGYLLDTDNDIPSEAVSEPVFTDEMMVLCGLTNSQFNKLLDAMKRNKCTVSLKAVLTETNEKWSSQKLHEELYAEYLSFKSSGGQPVHRK